jgi:HEPN domain-containing protein
MDEAKRELVRSWLRKASHDLTASRWLGTCDPPLLDVAMCHCQEAAEKALRGYLVFYDQPEEDTHDVGLLLEQATVIEPPFASWRDAANRLTPLATKYVYPGLREDPSQEDYEEAVDDADTIVRQVLAFLPRALHPLKESP